MRFRATGYSVLILTLLLALLPSSFGGPEALGGPFVDVARPQSPRVVIEASRGALVGGITAILTPPVPASTSLRPVVAAAPARAISTQGVRLEARRVLRRSFAGLTPAPKAAAVVPSATTATKKPTHLSAAAVTRYRVAPGDTVWTIARRFATSVNAITAANGMASADRVRIGQVLVLPGGPTKAAAPGRPTPSARAAAPARPTASARAVRESPAASATYRVRGGDTLFAIARRYGTTVRAIAEANHLASTHRLKVGQRLTVPLASGGGTAPARELTTTQSTLTTTATARGFIWPARGLLTSRYGWRYRRHHDGIDLAAPHGSPIYAARAGRVAFAGWYYGYGRAVIIDHGEGLTTLYGHASSLLVRTGEMVRRGQVIGRIGCTGSCTGPHLHFEVRIGGRAVNPLRYLD